VTKVHVRESKAKLDEKGEMENTIKYSFPLLEKRVLAELEKYTFELWVECLIHRHNGMRAKIPLQLKKKEKEKDKDKDKKV